MTDVDRRLFKIPDAQWRVAWLLHVTEDASGTLHVDLDAFATSIGVPTDAHALEALIACVRQYAEALYNRPLPMTAEFTPVKAVLQH